MTRTDWTFAELEALSPSELDTVKAELLEAMRAEQNKRWQVMGSILFYQHQINKVLEK